MFDSNHENPELIWNDVVRETLKTAVLNSCKKLYAVQQPEYSTKWDEVNFIFCCLIFFLRNFIFFSIFSF